MPGRKNNLDEYFFEEFKFRLRLGNSLTHESNHTRCSQFFKKIVQAMQNTNQIYIICEVFSKSCSNLNYHIQVLADAMCKVITDDLNILERIKFDMNLSVAKATEQIITNELGLSKRYLLLANILREFPEISRECLLTAFSLNPTWKNYQNILHASNRMQELKIRPNGINLFTNEYNDTKEYDTTDSFYARHLSKTTCDDLITVIRSPRNKSLCWSIRWPDLSAQCLEMVCDSKHKIRMIENNVAASANKLKYYNLHSTALVKRVEQRAFIRLRKSYMKLKQANFTAIETTNNNLLGFLQHDIKSSINNSRLSCE